MCKRLIILSIVVVAAVGGLGGLGYHAVAKWAQGLEGARLGEFAEVAEQIRQDVKRKLDDFIRAEQQRRYTDYLYYYVPGDVAKGQPAQQSLPLLRSPLGEQLSNGFAYGYFQIEADGSIVTPYYPGTRPQTDPGNPIADDVQRLVRNIEDNVRPSITGRLGALGVPDQSTTQQAEGPSSSLLADNANLGAMEADNAQPAKSARGKNYPIESLKKETQDAQVLTQQRLFIASNQALVTPPPADVPQGPAQQQMDVAYAPQVRDLSEMVQIRIEPFVPLVVSATNGGSPIFDGQVFLLRHVQIEDRHLLQGFQLDERRLVAEVEESARRLMRDNMSFELPQLDPVNGQADNAEKAAYTAILDFGFGDLVLRLTELDPAWIAKRTGELHRIYFGIIAIVMAAVALALISLWHNVRTQVLLAQKKDDFISAVSHELRTPLTSIRMYAEMLERNWVKSQDKLAEYYGNMRQESERLSRLVENVLDFARLQKGRKQYRFELGNLDDHVGKVAEMMRPYAQQRGFTLRTDFGTTAPIAFDRDAVTQIVVNLIDNAVKYAGSASDRTVIIRTRTESTFTIIEVEDHGPGIPHRQRTKVFDPFYRCDDGPPLQGRPQGAAPATGTGLGLTLVKRFAEAHGGHAEVRSAQPTGTILRVSLCVPSHPLR